MTLTSLTFEQKLAALSLRFYSDLEWKPSSGDYYTTSRNDLELYQVVEIRDGYVHTRYAKSDSQEACSKWPVNEFLTDGFGPRRVWVPNFVLCPPEADDREQVVRQLVGDSLTDGQMALLVNLERLRGFGLLEDQCVTEDGRRIVEDHVKSGRTLVL